MSKITKTHKVAKAIRVGQNIIFNEKLADGRRSLKVYGWKTKEYDLAKRLLESMGCDVKMVKSRKFDPHACRVVNNIRLYVSEN
jgi:ASC-1-like (ASCH) protein